VDVVSGRSVRDAVHAKRALQRRADEHIVQQRAAHRVRQTVPERRRTATAAVTVRAARPRRLPARHPTAGPATGAVQPAGGDGIPGIAT